MRILIGVTACIAAYKAAELVRAFQKAGHGVRVCMTENAQSFVGLSTFRGLCQGHTKVSMFEDDDPIPHIHQAEWADALVIAPCTADVAAKMACGIADDLLTSTVLACTCPIFVAPAMNLHMYENPATQENLRTLQERGVHVISPDSGYLACGDVGPGKLPDPDDIAELVLGHMTAEGPLSGKRVLITSGPTVEPIDAVRYVSNHSSGKMGAAIAKAAADAGASVTVVSGPVSLRYDERAQVMDVRTAQEMLDACKGAFADADVAICAAAVADMRPENASEKKLKKGRDDELLSCIRMVKNPDILASLGAAKRPDQIVVGFAAETDDVLENARKKLQEKACDMIVANDVSKDVFGSDEDAVTLITSSGCETLPRMSKADIAKQLMKAILDLQKNKPGR
ncbi:MAG: bifunctional phosphopantothenoylcysteine decarboxylase/phosphopantothenate--cysteine ligase CoaBC [Eggerthellaceae bacterium]|nr:bifunctional phosphopantothenoylcysteine decarboxylase/phosphopantothenate--cysteine ligase CoaBC [Eggerthellaceae bacterium]